MNSQREEATAGVAAIMTRGFRAAIKVSQSSNHIQTHPDTLYNSLIVSAVITTAHLIL